MFPITSTRENLNRWNDDSIRPGVVGSIGDVNPQVKFKHSAPDMALRYDPYFSGKNLPLQGANVTDGTHLGFDSGGGPATTINTNWVGHRDFKTNRGYIYQDLRIPDRSASERVEAVPQYSWLNHVSKVYDVKTKGDQWLPLPNGYKPMEGMDLRGAAPRVTDVAGGDQDAILGTIGTAGTDIVDREGKVTETEFRTSGVLANKPLRNTYLPIPELVAFPTTEQRSNPKFIAGQRRAAFVNKMR
jgi:hypothetical protein